MCEIFFIPYNRKVWKRPLHTLTPSGFQWTITHPDFEQVLKGALAPQGNFDSYNARGWYTRPPGDFPVRGMEVISRCLAARVSDLRLEHQVESIDLESRMIVARHRGERFAFRYRKGCCATLPLPKLLDMCKQTTKALREGCKRLLRNRVISVALCIRGPRPEGRGHWRYFADPSLIFNRLVYMHAFDPLTAPPDGWGLMAEITERAEDAPSPERQVLDRVREDVERAGALPPDCEIVGSLIIHVDPAYVVFTLENARLIAQARAFMCSNDFVPLGRYGRWEYSSMSQVMRDGFAWADAMNKRMS